MTIHSISDETAINITVGVLRDQWESAQEDIARLNKEIQNVRADRDGIRSGLGYKLENLLAFQNLNKGIEIVIEYMTVLDDCAKCRGMRGGVKGDENVINGVVTCEYCLLPQ